MKICFKQIVIILAIVSQCYAYSYEFKGNKWIGAKATIWADIPGISNSGIAWNSALLSAVQEWNERTVFDLTVVPLARESCKSDGFNSIKFATDLCGQTFNDATIAVTMLKYKEQQLGPDAIVEADIVVREDIPLDIFDGDLQQKGRPLNSVDFRRTVLHELGHVIGLDHEQLQVAIMQPELSDIFNLQPDDIAGANKLYTGLTNCSVDNLRFGKVKDSLDASDCTVRDLTLGGSDDSLIDLYRFKISATTQVDFTIDSDELESVLIIADRDLNYLAIDSDVSGDCGASIKTQLGAGEYFLMVNTFDTQIQQECKLAGGYELTANYLGESPIDLNQYGDSNNTESKSRFYGSITANGGETFGNLFSPKDSLDISASIDIDPSHRGQDGFIVVAALIENVVMLLNEKKQFVEFSSLDKPIIPVLEKKLEGIETLEIARDLVAEVFDIQAITVDFFVGYGLTEDGNQIYTHAKPFNLTIAPSIEEY